MGEQEQLETYQKVENEGKRATQDRELEKPNRAATTHLEHI